MNAEQNTKKKLMVINKLRYLERRFESQLSLMEEINKNIMDKMSGADLSRYLSGKALPSGDRLEQLWELLLSDHFVQLDFREIITEHSHIIKIDPKIQIDLSYLLSDSRALRTICDLALYRRLKTIDGRQLVLSEQQIRKVVTLEVDGIPFASAIASTLGEQVDMVYIRQSPTYDMLKETEWGQYYFTPADGRLQGLFLPRKFIKRGERILVVDDVINSGQSLRGMVTLIRKLEGIPIAILVLYSHRKDYKRLAEDYPGIDIIVLFDQ